MKWALIIGLAVWVGVLAFTVASKDWRITQLECSLAQAWATVEALENELEVSTQQEGGDDATMD